MSDRADDDLPEEALQAATKQKATLAPTFIDEIETHLALEGVDRFEPNPLFFLFQLLDEWRAFYDARRLRWKPYWVMRSLSRRIA